MTDGINIAAELERLLADSFCVDAKTATNEQIYLASAALINKKMQSGRAAHEKKTRDLKAKKVYYLCMEFLLGRMLHSDIRALGIEAEYEKALTSFGFSVDDIYAFEPDPGLGNGGLGRLAACFMDSLAALGYPAMGHTICYEYGLFRQVIKDGEQREEPDDWLSPGSPLLIPRYDKKTLVRFGGSVSEYWENGRNIVFYKDCDEVVAVPYDVLIPGKNGESIVTLRAWKSEGKNGFDMNAFSAGEHVRASDTNTRAQAISKVLYPADGNREGKKLRLIQQYFLVCASLRNIVDDHILVHGSIESLSEKASIHINDTHPSLAIPELMRILMDEFCMEWEKAWDICVNTFSYTNHTVLPEALECWSEELVNECVPRIYKILQEIDYRFCADSKARSVNPEPMRVISSGVIKMANLCVIGSHAVNGVSRLHSDILKADVFSDFNSFYPGKLTNVTNGIAHRRWLLGCNPALANLLDDTIGASYRASPDLLNNFTSFTDDKSVLGALANIKHRNKQVLSDYLLSSQGIKIDPSSIFDVQAKRMHEYKRQLLNAIHIIHLMLKIKENPNAVTTPVTFLFGAKAAPGYKAAKDIIRLLCYLSMEIAADKSLSDKLNVVFIENYSVSIAELLIPAADISEQISLAGKEASGTGNMKFMMNGALTVGTLDGANVEIAEQVGFSEQTGGENIFIFGLRSEEAASLSKNGYSPADYYNSSPDLKAIIASLRKGYAGKSFDDIADYLKHDPYMCFADFYGYKCTREKAHEKYNDALSWQKSALINIAKSGVFASDRSIQEYAQKIWNLKTVD